MQHLAIAAARIETATGAMTVPLRAFVGSTADEARRLATEYAAERGHWLAALSTGELVTEIGHRVERQGSLAHVLGQLGISRIEMVVSGSVAHSSHIETAPAGLRLV
jgi:hypothetical protein